MFGNKSKAGIIRSDSTTLIAKGTEIRGEVSFRGCLEIEGVVRGNIVVEPDCDNAQVNIQNSGQVYGDICAPIVVINSTIEGNVYSSKRVEMAANAVVHGDVHYQIIEMVKGAQVNGGLLYSKDFDRVNGVDANDANGDGKTEEGLAVDSNPVLG